MVGQVLQFEQAKKCKYLGCKYKFTRVPKQQFCKYCLIDLVRLYLELRDQVKLQNWQVEEVIYRDPAANLVHSARIHYWFNYVVRNDKKVLEKRNHLWTTLNQPPITD